MSDPETIQAIVDGHKQSIANLGLSAGDLDPYNRVLDAAGNMATEIARLRAALRSILWMPDGTDALMARCMAAEALNQNVEISHAR